MYQSIPRVTIALRQPQGIRPKLLFKGEEGGEGKGGKERDLIRVGHLTSRSVNS